MLRISRVGGWSLATLMLAAWAGPVAAVEGDPDLATVLAEGQTHLRRGENQLALATFRHAVELSGGTSFLAWKGMANTQMWLQQYGAAVESAKQTRSLAATPEEQSAATSLLVGALLPENRDAEAAEVLRAYRATGATDRDVRLLLCHVRPILGASQLGTVNDRLRALDPAAPAGVGGNVSRPEILEHTPPMYTEVARKARLQGTVILQTVIGTNGTTEDVEVLKGLPMGLDKSAIEAVQTWRFKPATLDGVPVPVCYVLTVNFQIQDKPKDAAGEAPPK